MSAIFCTLDEYAGGVQILTAGGQPTMPSTVSSFVKLQIAVLAAVVAAVASPASSLANPTHVPPGLSGANQYTETLPGPGGDEPTSSSGKAAGKPEETLGKADTERMEAQGPEGRAAAELAAQTAPEATAESAPSPTTEPSHHSKRSKASKQKHGSKQKSGSKKKRTSHAKNNAAATSKSFEQAGPSGSSGVEQVAASLAGSSDSGGMGPLLPILIGLAAIFAIGYLIRNRSLRPHE
jgi:hypothetical protein